jgi:hypothetical protein
MQQIWTLATAGTLSVAKATGSSEGGFAALARRGVVPRQYSLYLSEQRSGPGDQQASDSGCESELATVQNQMSH